MAQNKEKAEAEAPLEIDSELEEYLQTDPRKGLSDGEVSFRLQKFGRNGMCRAVCVTLRTSRCTNQSMVQVFGLFYWSYQLSHRNCRNHFW